MCVYGVGYVLGSVFPCTTVGDGRVLSASSLCNVCTSLLAYFDQQADSIHAIFRWHRIRLYGLAGQLVLDCYPCRIVSIGSAAVPHLTREQEDSC